MLNHAQPSGHVRNIPCTGVSLILDEREPPDDGEGPYRTLRHLPEALVVQPEVVEVSGVLQAEGHREWLHCIPVRPAERRFRLQLPERMPLTAGGAPQSSVQIQRRGFPLDLAYAVTDYWTQGMNFGRSAWLLDLTPPPTGGLSRASVVVPLTRYRDWDEVRLLRPLWPPGDDRAARNALDRLWRALRPDRELHEEWARLAEVEHATLERHAGLCQALQESGA